MSTFDVNERRGKIVWKREIQSWDDYKVGMITQYHK